MADETTDKPAAETKPPDEAKTATAAETAAAQALKASADKDKSTEEVKAADTTKQQAVQAEETADMVKNPADDGDTHVVADLMPASQRIFGVPPEVVAGAAHFGGLEMTSETTIPSLAAHIEAFLAAPA